MFSIAQAMKVMNAISCKICGRCHPSTNEDAGVRRRPMLVWPGVSLASLCSCPHHVVGFRSSPWAAATTLFICFVSLYIISRDKMLCLVSKLNTPSGFRCLGEGGRVQLPDSLAHCHLVGAPGTATASCCSVHSHGAPGTCVSGRKANTTCPLSLGKQTEHIYSTM